MEAVPKWYAGKTILVTGATGFMGKVLLEKLLRSCPEIKKIYILCRPKRGVNPQSRLDALAKVPVFERLLKENPNQLKKIHVIEGDILYPGLGIRFEDLAQLEEEVSIVFNVAASLKLEAGLKDNIEANTRATQKILDLCLKMKKLVAFIHFSTAFCHPEESILEDKVYSPPANPHDIMKAMEWMDDESIKMITPKILDGHPNSYTYAKRLTEYLVHEYCQSIPVVIMRPSIVLPCIKDPMPGWVDNLNGPIGILVGAGKGVIRSMLGGTEFRAECIPVDSAVNSVILAAYKRGIKSHADYKTTEVYNVSSNDLAPITWGEVITRGKQVIAEYPLEIGLWYPNGEMRSSKFWHYFFVIFTQLIPAYFIDALLFIFGQKTFMVRVQNRIWLGMSLLEYFTNRDWRFKNSKMLSLHDDLSENDKQTFFIGNIEWDASEVIKNAILGARQYCLKEPLETLPKARKQLKLLYVIDLIGKAFLLYVFGWLLLKMFALAKYPLNKVASGTVTSSMFIKT